MQRRRRLQFSAFDINAITLFRVRSYFLGNLTEAGDAKPLAHVFSVIGLADSDDDAWIFFVIFSAHRSAHETSRGARTEMTAKAGFEGLNGSGPVARVHQHVYSARRAPVLS